MLDFDALLDNAIAGMEAAKPDAPMPEDLGYLCSFTVERLMAGYSTKWNGRVLLLITENFLPEKEEWTKEETGSIDDFCNRYLGVNLMEQWIRLNSYRVFRDYINSNIFSSVPEITFDANTAKVFYYDNIHLPALEELLDVFCPGLAPGCMEVFNLPFQCDPSTRKLKVSRPTSTLAYLIPPF